LPQEKSMTIVLDTPSQARFVDVQARLIDYASRVKQLRSPDEVLDELNTITTQSLSLSVLGAARPTPSRKPCDSALYPEVLKISAAAPQRLGDAAGKVENAIAG
jgi:hypothetical protein